MFGKHKSGHSSSQLKYLFIHTYDQWGSNSLLIIHDLWMGQYPVQQRGTTPGVSSRMELNSGI